MGGMELRHLRYFVAVAETLNFTAAARKLGMAQPPLSIQIRKLEEELGSALFDRSSRKIQLTPAGLIFFGDARNLLAQADRAIQGLQDAVAGRIGEITICHTPSIFSDRISRRIRKFIRKHRGVRINLRSVDLAQVHSAAFTNYDAYIHDTCARENRPGIVLEKAPILVAVAPKHRLAAHGEISPADLLGERILLAPEPRRSAAERYLAGLIQELDIPIVPAPSDPLERLWHASLGIGVTVCSSQDRFTLDAVLVPLAGQDAETLTILTSNPSSRAAGLSALIDFIRE